MALAVLQLLLCRLRGLKRFVVLPPTPTKLAELLCTPMNERRQSNNFILFVIKIDMLGLSCCAAANEKPFQIVGF